MEQITDKRASKHTSSELYSLVISSLIHILPCHSVMSYPAMSLLSCRYLATLSANWWPSTQSYWFVSEKLWQTLRTAARG